MVNFSPEEDRIWTIGVSICKDALLFAKEKTEKLNAAARLVVAVKSFKDMVPDLDVLQFYEGTPLEKTNSEQLDEVVSSVLSCLEPEEPIDQPADLFSEATFGDIRFDAEKLGHTVLAEILDQAA